MRQTLTLLATILLCLTMQGCVSTQSISVAVPPTLVEPDARLLATCLGPVRLPKGVLTQGDVERLWISDRKALIQCGKRHAAVVEFYLKRDAELRNILRKEWSGK